MQITSVTEEQTDRRADASTMAKTRVKKTVHRISTKQLGRYSLQSQVSRDPET